MAVQNIGVNTDVYEEKLRASTIVRYWREFRRWPVIPALIIVLLITVAIFAPLIAPKDPERSSLRDRHNPPMWMEGGSSENILGTDFVGSDIFSRIIYGARISLLIASIVLAGGVIGGTLIGLVSGWYGGQVDEFLMRFVDFTLAVPFILIAIVVIIVMGQSLTVIILLLVIFSWAGFARQVRAETLSLKTEIYIDAARIVGAPTTRIFLRHIFPGLTSTIVVISTLRVGTLILTESTLSYLGVGVPPPTPAWGVMVADGRQYVDSAWWESLFPGLAIMMVVLAFNFFGDWVRDYLDPRLRQTA